MPLYGEKKLNVDNLTEALADHESRLNARIPDKTDYQDLNGHTLSVVAVGDKDILVYQDSKEGFARGLEGLRGYIERNGNVGVANAPDPDAQFNTNIAALAEQADQRHNLTTVHKGMFFHVWRVVNHLPAPGLSDATKQGLFDKAFAEVYLATNEDIAKYLNTTPNVTIKMLNKFVDGKRKEHAKIAEEKVRSLLEEKGCIIRSREEVSGALNNNTAINIDTLETNEVTGVTTHTRGADTAVHGKKTSAPSIMRIDKYKNGDFSKPIQTQYRAGSLVDSVIDGKRVSVAQHIQNFVTNDVGIPKDNGDLDLAKKPVVYNLMTSVSMQNKQDKTAAKIMQGMHKYNKSKGDNQPFFYVMNIPVNQTTSELSHDSWMSPTAREAMICADLAMLMTLPVSYLDVEGVGDKVEKIKKCYDDFLAAGAKGNFSDSPQGKKAIPLIKELKGEECFSSGKPLGENDKTTPKEKLQAIFLKLYCADVNKLEKKHGLMLQGMFLALSNNHNLKGCKSGVDRYNTTETINDMFLAYTSGKLPDGFFNRIDRLITDYLAYTEEETGAYAASAGADMFVMSMHKINADFNTYVADAASYSDTGPPKSQTSSRDNLEAENNTNKFVPEEYDALEQGNASEEQSHKGVKKRLGKMCDQNKSMQNATGVDGQAAAKKYLDMLNKYASGLSVDLKFTKLGRQHIVAARNEIRRVEDFKGDITDETVKAWAIDLQGIIEKEASYNAEGKLMIGLAAHVKAESKSRDSGAGNRDTIERGSGHGAQPARVGGGHPTTGAPDGDRISPPKGPS
jgi:hypothetical protein